MGLQTERSIGPNVRLIEIVVGVLVEIFGGHAITVAGFCTREGRCNCPGG